MPPPGGPGSQRAATRARRKQYERRQRNLAKLPKATPRPIVRPAPTRPTTKIGQEIARERQREQIQKRAARARARVPKRPTPLRPTPTATQRARAQERYYASQGRAVETQAISDPALREIERYVNQPVAKRRQQLAQIRTKAPSERTLGEENILRIHRGRHAADVKMVKTVGFLPRVRYGYTPKVTKYNVVQPSAKQRQDRALQAKILARQYARPGSAEHRALVNRLTNVPGAIEALKTRQATKSARRLAPAMTVLEQVSRPVHGVAGGARAAVRGENVARAVGRGVTLKDNYLFSDVLKEAGLGNKALRGVLGFGLDVALDPTTYVGLGVTSVARAGARKAAEQAAESAARAKLRDLAPRVAAGELSHRQARALARETGRRRARATFERHMREATPAQRAPAIRTRVTGARTARRAGRAVRRRILPGKAERRVRRLGPAAPLTRLTAASGRGTRAALEAVPQPVRQVGRVGRRVAAGAHAGIRPLGVSRTEHQAVKAIRREARAEQERLGNRATARAHPLVKQLTRPQDRRAVIDAIEADDLRGLSDDLRLIARRVRDELRYRRRVEGRSGALYSRVGVRGRGREETQHLAQAGRSLPSTRKLQQARSVARAASAQAREALRHARPEQRANARARLVQAVRYQQRLERRIQGVEAQRAQILQARSDLRRSQKERLEGEARGYFPHIEAEEIKTPFQRLAQPERALPERFRRPSPVKARQYREPLAAMREGSPAQQARAARFTEDVPAALRQGGERTAQKVGDARAARKLVETLGEKLDDRLLGPQGSGFRGTAQELNRLKGEGRSVYHLRGGQLQKLGLDDIAEIRRAAEGKATLSGGRYAILRDDLVREVGRPDRIPGSELAPLAAFDLAQRGFKRVALLTPGYLVRNLLGDAFNAWGRENAFRLLYNVARGQRALRAIGKLEKAERTFSDALSPKLRQIRLTPEQAREIAGPSAQRLHQALRRVNPDLTQEQVRAMVERQLSEGKVDALGLAQLAERMGVIRQGRFLELMQEGRQVKPARSGWNRLSRRIEDSMRIATFLGGLQRGLAPREAAARATRVHFDYGDLTAFEKGVSRRLMPFYTFTSRNIPLQAATLATRPGKYAQVYKAREEARRYAELPEGYEGQQGEYDARQLGIPVRVGDRVFSVSVGSPFVDLNDIARPTPRTIGDKLAGLATPYGKVPIELMANHSFFYRDQIKTKDEPLTRAPQWALAAAKVIPGFAEATGLTPDYVPATGEQTWGWDRKWDYGIRQLQVGPSRLLIELTGQGVKGPDARGQSYAQRVLGGLGLRTAEYKQNKGRIDQLYDEAERVDAQMALLRRRAHPSDRQPNGKPYRIGAEHPTPEYTRLQERAKAIETELVGRARVENPEGYVRGQLPKAPAVGGSKLPLSASDLRNRRGSALPLAR